MYIRRKVFSTIVENGVEKLYSVNETIFNAEEKTFAEKKEKDDERVALKDVKSARGIGRGLVAGGGIVPVIVSRAAAGKAANKADKEGASDLVIVEKAKSAGTKAGAATGAVLSGVAVAKAVKDIKRANPALFGKYDERRKVITIGKKALRNKKVAAAVIGTGAAVGALGAGIAGRLSASKMTRDRLVKRYNKEQRNKKD